MNIQQILQLLMTVAPALLKAMQDVAAARGLPLDHPVVAQAVIDHNTPGAPGAPELA